MDSQFFANRETEIKFFFALVLILLLFLVTSFVLSSRIERGDVSNPTRTVQEFPPILLKAKSAYVYDARTQTVLFALNENTRLPLASLTKVMAALVAEELTPSYSTVVVSGEAIATNGDSGLKVKERWSLRDILDFSLISSSNDGIRAVALSLGALASTEASQEEILADFVHAMNMKASDLDLKNTYFWNETGLDESEIRGGAYGTSRDFARLLEYIIISHPEMLEATRETSSTITSLDNYKHLAKNTNALVEETPGLLASKTGFTSTAGGNLAFVFDPELGRPIIVTILGSTADGRFEDAKKLINATFQYINNSQ